MVVTGCVLLGVSTARADTKQFTNELALALQKAGWTNATRLHDSPAVRVIAATKQGKRHVVYATADGAATFALVTGDQVPANHEVTVTENVAYGKLTGIAAVNVSYEEKRANNGYSLDARTVFVRTASATVACVIEANAQDQAGTQCGSKGWRSVSVRAIAGENQPTFDVSISLSGSSSKLDKASGQCQYASPVRPMATVTRVVITPTGMCTKSAAPPKPSKDI
jgi:hypothetical protein